MAIWSIRSLAPLVFVIGTACAAGPDPSKQPVADTGQRTFGETYSYIAQRYIDPVSVRTFAVNAMQGLKAIDPDITIAATDGQIAVRRGNEVTARVPMPARDDAREWGVASVAVVRAAADASPKIKTATSEKIYEVMFEAALGKLDKFSRYQTAEDARDARAVRDGYSGIGISIQVVDGVTKVAAVMPSAPAEIAGLRVNDTITRVNGQPIQGFTLRQVVNELRGPEGTAVKLTVVRENVVAPLDVSVERRHIVPDTVVYRREGDGAYIKLTRFNQRTGRQLAEQVARARADLGPGFGGLILDLRDNPGGLLDQAIYVSDLFLARGKIVSTHGRHPDSLQSYDASNRDILDGRPLIVLINGRSASSSEIVAAALQDHGRAIVVGSTSFGKGTVQTVFTLPNEGELILTWSRFHSPHGYILQGLGVAPTLCLSAGATPASVMADLRQNKLKMAATLREWQLQTTPNEQKFARLRAVCPPYFTTNPKADPELEVARQLLHEPVLIERAMRLGNTHSTASTPQDPPPGRRHQ
ncbi:MAG: S41 family peptidase [Alphaproteobacteria bacterium]